MEKINSLLEEALANLNSFNHYVGLYPQKPCKSQPRFCHCCGRVYPEPGHAEYCIIRRIEEHLGLEDHKYSELFRELALSLGLPEDAAPSQVMGMVAALKCVAEAWKDALIFGREGDGEGVKFGTVFD
jgi:hypothetical protein